MKGKIPTFQENKSEFLGTVKQKDHERKAKMKIYHNNGLILKNPL